MDTYRHFFYIGWQVVEVRVTDSPSAVAEDIDPEYQYVWSARYVDAPILRDENKDDDGDCINGDDERLYYLTDANMNVTALADSSGTVGERYVYDPYGRAAVFDGSWNGRGSSSYDNAVLFAGYYHDAETGFYHVRNRMYHPRLGAWLQRDPIGYWDGMNLYEYVGGRPVGLTDPLGLMSWVPVPLPFPGMPLPIPVPLPLPPSGWNPFDLLPPGLDPNTQKDSPCETDPDSPGQTPGTQPATEPAGKPEGAPYPKDQNPVGWYRDGGTFIGHSAAGVYDPSTGKWVEYNMIDIDVNWLEYGHTTIDISERGWPIEKVYTNIWEQDALTDEEASVLAELWRSEHGKCVIYITGLNDCRHITYRAYMLKERAKLIGWWKRVRENDDE